jgi:diaminopimelate decarboxylase
MHLFSYRNGILHAENVPVDALAKRHGTPLYIYSRNTIRDHYRRLDGALAGLDHTICYAVKANSNLAVLATIAEMGGGFDIVSGGELFRVMKAGGDPARCTFAGVGKTRAEIGQALDAGICSFNVESQAELVVINEEAGQRGVKAPVALRVNPNVDAKTHKYISTGKSENKFGIDFEHIRQAYDDAAKLPHLQLKGLQMHIGSQLTSVGPFAEAVEKVAPLARELKEKHGIEFFSIGGGIGIIYKDSLPSGDSAWWGREDGAETKPLTLDLYASAVKPVLSSLGLRIFLEPGRVIVGNAGILVTEVLYRKQGTAKTFQIVDAGMNDLLRPALYQGHHEIVPVKQPVDDVREKVDVVGPICETGDFLAQDRDLSPVEQGGLLAALSAGAYGFSMASNYNSRPLPAEILVDGDAAWLVRERQSMDDLIRGERLPGPQDSAV